MNNIEMVLDQPVEMVLDQQGLPDILALKDDPDLQKSAKNIAKQIFDQFSSRWKLNHLRNGFTQSYEIGQGSVTLSAALREKIKVILPPFLNQLDREVYDHYMDRCCCSCWDPTLLCNPIPKRIGHQARRKKRTRCEFYQMLNSVVTEKLKALGEAKKSDLNGNVTFYVDGLDDYTPQNLGRSCVGSVFRMCCFLLCTVTMNPLCGYPNDQGGLCDSWTGSIEEGTGICCSPFCGGNTYSYIRISGVADKSKVKIKVNWELAQNQ